jgi:hypothetical protein
VPKVKAKAYRGLVSVVGSLASVSPGEWVTAEGRWVQDREFGQQFRAEMLTSTAPTTAEGIEKYLGSGMVKGTRRSSTGTSARSPRSTRWGARSRSSSTHARLCTISANSTKWPCPIGHPQKQAHGVNTPLRTAIASRRC